MVWKKIVLGLLFVVIIAGIVIVVSIDRRCLSKPPTSLSSEFLRGDPNANRIMNCNTYDIDDPAWISTKSGQNKDIFAYKLFAAFHMLGYQTHLLTDKPHVKVLNKFQNQVGLPETNLFTQDALLKLDSLLSQREQKVSPVGKNFLLYSHMQQLHPNDISRDSLAYIYSYPISVLPNYLHMSEYETVQCIYHQCLGFIQDADGNQWSSYPIELTSDYRFVGAYFDPQKNNARLPSAAIFVGTVLHEYGHYLDGEINFTQEEILQLHKGLIDTFDFHNIGFDLNKTIGGCAPRRSNNPKDYISRYGFGSSYGNCDQGLYRFREEFAEAFSIYVVSGMQFREAASQNSIIAKKYNWLKDNVFEGREYDTDLPSGSNSGCNDLPGYEDREPGYASCDEDYVWDGELKIK